MRKSLTNGFLAKNRELIFAEHIFGNEVCQACCTGSNLSVDAGKLLKFNMEIMEGILQYPGSG